MSASSSGGKGGARLAQLVSAQPSVREVPSSIPGVNTSLFQLLFFFCVALTIRWKVFDGKKVD